MKLVPILGKDLRPGMRIRREENWKEKPETVQRLTGKCEKGLHYGSGCYAYIATWWVEQ